MSVKLPVKVDGLSPFGACRLFCLFFAGALVCLFLVYAAAVAVPYATHDSVRYFSSYFNSSASAGEYILRPWYTLQGRPLGGEIEDQVFRHMTHLADLSAVRALVVILLALNAAWLARFAVAMGFGRWTAFCLGVAMVTLPGVQESVFVPYLFHTVAMSLALAAYAVLSGPWGAPVRVAGAGGLLLIAFLTYPGMAFFFLVPGMFRVIRDDGWLADVRSVARDILFCLAVAVIYFLVVKVFFYNIQEMPAGYRIDTAPGHLAARLVEFLTGGVPRVFNFWNIHHSIFWGAVAALLTAFAWAWRAHLERRAGTWWRILAMAGILAVVNAPWLMTRQPFIPRIFAVSTAVTLLAVYGMALWALRRTGAGKAFPTAVLAGLFLAAGMVGANITVVRNVWNANAEIMFIRARLLPYLDNSTKGIRIIQPDDLSRGYNGYGVIADQFNAPVAGYDFELADLVRTALHDVFDPAGLQCRLIIHRRGEPLPPPDSRVILLDMNDLARTGRWRR